VKKKRFTTETQRHREDRREFEEGHKRRDSPQRHREGRKQKVEKSFKKEAQEAVLTAAS
jgi:hypothetical protein